MVGRRGRSGRVASRRRARRSRCSKQRVSFARVGDCFSMERPSRCARGEILGSPAYRATGRALSPTSLRLSPSPPPAPDDPRQAGGAARPARLIEAGVARVPDDRQALGVIGDMRVWENAIIERFGSSRFSRLGLIRRSAARAYAQELVERYDMRGAAHRAARPLLSGGNIQKLILGRELAARLGLSSRTSRRAASTWARSLVHAQLLEAKAAAPGSC